MSNSSLPDVPVSLQVPQPCHSKQQLHREGCILIASATFMLGEGCTYLATESSAVQQQGLYLGTCDGEGTNNVEAPRRTEGQCRRTLKPVLLQKSRFSAYCQAAQHA